MELSEMIGDGIGCTICKVAVKIISYEVKTFNASVEIIEKEVRAVCALYPIKAAKEAVRIVFLLL